MQGAAKHRRRLADHVRAQPQRFRRIDAVANAAGGDKRHSGQPVAHGAQRFISGNAPVGEGHRHRALLRRAGAFAFYRRPAGAARACDVDHADARLGKPLRNLRRDARADLFHDDRYFKRFNQLRNRLQHAAPVAVAAALQRFLQRIKMDDQRIRFNHAYRVLCQPAALLAENLRGAQVGQQRNIRGDTAQVARQAEIVVAFQRHAL